MFLQSKKKTQARPAPTFQSTGPGAPSQYAGSAYGGAQPQKGQDQGAQRVPVVSGLGDNAGAGGGKGWPAPGPPYVSSPANTNPVNLHLQQHPHQQNIPGTTTATAQVPGAAAAAVGVGSSGRHLPVYSDPIKPYGASLSDNTSEPQTREFYRPPPGFAGGVGGATTASATPRGFPAGAAAGAMPPSWNSHFPVVGGGGGNGAPDRRAMVHQTSSSGFDMDAYAQYMAAASMLPPSMPAPPEEQQRINGGDATGECAVPEPFLFFFSPDPSERIHFIALLEDFYIKTFSGFFFVFCFFPYFPNVFYGCDIFFMVCDQEKRN